MFSIRVDVGSYEAHSVDTADVWISDETVGSCAVF